MIQQPVAGNPKPITQICIPSFLDDQKNKLTNQLYHCSFFAGKSRFSLSNINTKYLKYKYVITEQKNVFGNLSIRALGAFNKEPICFSNICIDYCPNVFLPSYIYLVH